MKEENQKTPDEVKEALQKIEAEVRALKEEVEQISEIEDDNERAERLFDALRKLSNVGLKKGDSNE